MLAKVMVGSGPGPDWVGYEGDVGRGGLGRTFLGKRRNGGGRASRKTKKRVNGKATKLKVQQVGNIDGGLADFVVFSPFHLRPQSISILGRPNDKQIFAIGGG